MGVFEPGPPSIFVIHISDRIKALLERHIPNLRSSLLRRVVLSPADLEQANSNLVGGDPFPHTHMTRYAWSCTSALTSIRSSPLTRHPS